jgi:FAD synthase
MKIIRSLEEFSDTKTPVILAAGCFDGLHIGHTAVIQVAIERARAIGGEAWVYTFDPHPAKVLSPDHAPPLIFTTDQQSRHLQEMGVDGCILQPFTIDFMKHEPVDFFDHLCNCIPELAGISVGEDWSFGKNRSGNPALLTKLCGKQNIFFIDEMNFENLRLVFMESFAVADIGGGVVEAVAHPKLGGINSARWQHVIFGVNVGGGIAESATDFLTVHDGSNGTDRLP